MNQVQTIRTYEGGGKTTSIESTDGAVKSTVELSGAKLLKEEKLALSKEKDSIELKQKENN